jgi:hypothetical protein
MLVSGRAAKDQEQLEQRYAELMRTIAWLEALPTTTIPDVVANQRARAIEELAQTDLHRARRGSTKSEPSKNNPKYTVLVWEPAGQGSQVRPSKPSGHANLTAFPILFFIVGTMATGVDPKVVPVVFISAVTYFGVATAVLHFIERWVRPE